MALPKQVQKQLDEVNALEEQLINPTISDDADQIHGDKPDEETVAKEEEGIKASSVDSAVDGKDLKSAPEPEVQVDYEQKYKTLRGKYDAEVPRLYAQVKELNGKLEEAIGEIQTLKEKSVEVTPEKPVRLVTDADKEEFGEDLLDVSRRVAREEVAEELSELKKMNALLRAEVTQLKDRVEKTDERVGEVDFGTHLRRLIPDYDEVNSDSRWIDWLNQEDPILRGPRRIIAQAAFDKGDAEAVADYVKLFKQSLRAEESSKPKAELERQVTPSRATAASTPTSVEPRVYTQAEIDKSWVKISDLYKQGKVEEAEKLEAKISAAYTEGRIRP